MTKATKQPFSKSESHEYSKVEQVIAEGAQAVLMEAGLAVIKTEPPAVVPKTAYATMSVSQLIGHLQAVHTRTILEMSALGLPATAAQEHANLRWRAELPDLIDRHSVMQFIALVAWGTRNRVLDAAEGKMLIFLAQTQLSVLKPIEEATKRAAGAARNEPELFSQEVLGHEPKPR